MIYEGVFDLLKGKGGLLMEIFVSLKCLVFRKSALSELSGLLEFLRFPVFSFLPYLELIEHRRQQMEADLKTPEDKQVEEGDSDGEHSQLATMRSIVKTNTDANKSADMDTNDEKPNSDEIKDKDEGGDISVESSMPVNFCLSVSAFV